MPAVATSSEDEQAPTKPVVLRHYPPGKEKDYVREVDYETYKNYKDKLKKQK